MNFSGEIYIVRRVSKYVPEFSVYYSNLISEKFSSLQFSSAHYVEGLQIIEVSKLCVCVFN